MKKMYLPIIGVLLLLLTGCSDNTPEGYSYETAIEYLQSEGYEEMSEVNELDNIKPFFENAPENVVLNKFFLDGEPEEFGGTSALIAKSGYADGGLIMSFSKLDGIGGGYLIPFNGEEAKCTDDDGIVLNCNDVYSYVKKVNNELIVDLQALLDYFQVDYTFTEGDASVIEDTYYYKDELAFLKDRGYEDLETVEGYSNVMKKFFEGDGIVEPAVTMATLNKPYHEDSAFTIMLINSEAGTSENLMVMFKDGGKTLCDDSDGAMVECKQLYERLQAVNPPATKEFDEMLKHFGVNLDF